MVYQTATGLPLFGCQVFAPNLQTEQGKKFIPNFFLLHYGHLFRPKNIFFAILNIPEKFGDRGKRVFARFDRF